MTDPTLRPRIEAEARRLGFDAVGVARADLPLDADIAHYRAFVDAGMHGEMQWLAGEPSARERLDGEAILPGARSVICLARRYASNAEEEARTAPTARAIARYARGRDYHNGMRKKLRKLAAFLRTFVDDRGEPVRARPLCDQEPVLERAWAARAGLGFVGKNGLLIVPGTGSFVLLGEVVSTLPLPADAPMEERCGSCTRCLDVCPTQAFARPFVLDPRRCVAYLTIENRGPIPEALREGVGGHLFGCDDCQTVCPFNTKALTRGPALADPRLAADPRWEGVALTELLALDDEGFVRLREGSAVGRATRVGLARNAAVVLGTTGDASALPALVKAAETHDAEIVREAARWAVARIEGRNV